MPTSLPAYFSGTVRVVPHTLRPQAQTPKLRRRPSCWPPCRAASMTKFIAKNDQPGNATSPPLTENGTPPPLLKSAF
jgi:hypothetical protein